MTNASRFTIQAGAVGLAFALAACSAGSRASSADAPSQPPSSAPSSAPAATPSGVDVALADVASMSLDEQRAALADLTAPLERDLWTQVGLEEELGGASATDAAYEALTAALIGQATSMGRRPSFGRFGGSVANADETDAGSMLVGGFLLVGMGAELIVQSSNDLKPGERPQTSHREDADGTSDLEGTLETVSLKSTLDRTIDGVNGKLRTEITISPCPDPNGEFTAHALIAASATAEGGGTGAIITADVSVSGRVGDDAELIGYDSTNHLQVAKFQSSKGAFVDLTSTSSMTGGKATSAEVKQNRSGGAATTQMAQQWASAATFVGPFVSQYLSAAAETGWKSGRCVDLEITTAPAKRTGLAPSATVDVTAAPKSKIDGSAVGGTVTASLVGDTSLDPTGSPVPADASFTYTAPSEKDKAATASFEARSKRGVATASVDFDTKAARGYFIGPVTGGKHTITGLGIASNDDGSTMGTADPADVCDITRPFTLTSPANGGRQTFTPTSDTGGTTTYETTMPMTGFTEKGKGTYTLELSEDGGTIRTKVRGRLTLPGGAQSYRTTGVQVFSLRPATNCS